MKLFLLRHAHAQSGTNDKQRPLSHEGEETVRALAGFLSRHDRKLPETFRHSSLLRAQQTAEILAETLPGEHRCREIVSISRPSQMAAHQGKRLPDIGFRGKPKGRLAARSPRPSPPPNQHDHPSPHPDRQRIRQTDQRYVVMDAVRKPREARMNVVRRAGKGPFTFRE